VLSKIQRVYKLYLPVNTYKIIIRRISDNFFSCLKNIHKIITNEFSIFRIFLFRVSKIG